jgi:hypothetical protein
MGKEHDKRMPKEIWPFAVAFWRHWAWWVCSILGFPIVVIIRARGVVISDWILMPLAMLGIVVAAFLTWRDQKHLTELAETKLQEAVAAHAKEMMVVEEKNKPILAIELEAGENGWNGNTAGVCRIIVKNTSQHLSANNVGVSLVKITPNPSSPPRPLPYELGQSGTNCAVKKVQLHAGMPIMFDLFWFHLHSDVHFRTFQIHDVPQTNLVLRCFRWNACKVGA